MAAENVEEKKGRRRKRAEESTDTGAIEGKGRSTPGRRAGETSSSGGGNFITRAFGGTFEYLSEVRSELRKVTWPTPEEVRRLTIVVLIVTIASAIVLGLFSLFVGEVVRLGLRTPIIFAVIGVVTVGAAIWYTRRGTATRSY